MTNVSCESLGLKVSDCAVTDESANIDFEVSVIAEVSGMSHGLMDSDHSVADESANTDL